MFPFALFLFLQSPIVNFNLENMTGDEDERQNMNAEEGEEGFQWLLGTLQNFRPYADYSTERFNDLISSVLNPSISLYTPTDEEILMHKINEEEQKVRHEIISIIRSGNTDSLNANTLGGTYIFEHPVCIRFEDNYNLNQRNWMWHGHIVLYEQGLGYRPQYFHDWYDEELPRRRRNKGRKNLNEEGRGGGNVGLRGVTRGSSSTNGRIITRNMRVR